MTTRRATLMGQGSLTAVVGGSSDLAALYLAKASNLADLIDAAAARANLGLEIGADVQAYDSDLAAIAALSTTSYGRALLTLADLAALYTALAVDTDGTLAANSDVKLPSQKAVK